MTNAEARFNKSHIRKVYACLAVTCHLHFWQNDRDFLRATVVTWGWNRYRNKSQHRKSTLEKKILPPFQQGFEPATFQSRVQRSNHWAIPAPHIVETVILWLYKPTLWPWPWKIESRFFAWHSGSWWCTTIPSLVTKGCKETLSWVGTNTCHEHYIPHPWGITSLTVLSLF